MNDFKEFIESDLGFNYVNDVVYHRERWSNPSNGRLIEAEISRKIKGLTNEQKVDKLIELKNTT